MESWWLLEQFLKLISNELLEIQYAILSQINIEKQMRTAPLATFFRKHFELHMYVCMYAHVLHVHLFYTTANTFIFPCV